MSSIGTGYDLAASTFSPDGRIFQVEYANKAVESSASIIALGCKDGVLVAVDQPVPSKLTFGDANTRIMNVTETIGFAGSGLYPDLISLLDYTREEAENYLKEYREPIKIKKLAKTVSERVHIFTLGISRPYGAALFLVAWDKETGPAIYSIDSAGQCLKFYAWVIGKSAQAAKTEIEKLENRDQMDKAALAKKAIHILLSVREEGTTNQSVEMAWVGRDTEGRFERIAQDQIDNWANIVQEEIARMEQQDD